MRTLIALVLVAFSITANAVELPKPQEGGDPKGVYVATLEYSKQPYSGTYVVELHLTPAFYEHFVPKGKNVIAPPADSKARITVGEEQDYVLVEGLNEADEVISSSINDSEFFLDDIESLEKLKWARGPWSWYAGDDTYVGWSTHGWTIIKVKGKLPVRAELGNFMDDGPPSYCTYSVMRDGRYTRIDKTNYLPGTSKVTKTVRVTKQPDSKELMEALKKGVIEAKAAKAAEEAEARAIEEAKDKAALEGLIEPEDLKKDKAEQ